jgi:hypothetical protein
VLGMLKEICCLQEICNEHAQHIYSFYLEIISGNVSFITQLSKHHKLRQEEILTRVLCRFIRIQNSLKNVFCLKVGEEGSLK